VTNASFVYFLGRGSPSLKLQYQTLGICQSNRVTSSSVFLH